MLRSWGRGTRRLPINFLWWDRLLFATLDGETFVRTAFVVLSKFLLVPCCYVYEMVDRLLYWKAWSIDGLVVSSRYISVKVGNDSLGNLLLEVQSRSEVTSN